MNNVNISMISFRLVLMMALVYAGLVVWMWVRQESLLFMPNHWEPLPAYEKYRWDRTIDGLKHQGWFFDKGSDKTVIYHGGNAEDLAGHCEVLFNGLEANALLVNYRGYGQSEGKPGEKEMVSDGIAIVDLFCKEQGVDVSSVYLMGRSLGTGIATQVAAARSDVAGVILVTPYDSITSVAKMQYPWLPIDLLIRHPFRSHQIAPNLNIPALFLLAELDTVIPPENGQKLADAWGGPKQVITLPMGHNDINEHPDYFKAINAFVK